MSSIGPVFAEIPVPQGFEGSPLARASKWLTWSPEFLDFAKRWSPGHVRQPQVVTVNGDSHYDRTFTSDPSVFEDGEFAAELRRYAEGLTRLEPGDRLYLLDGLLDEDLDGLGLRALLAALRDALVREQRDPHAALYAPLGSTGPSSGHFRLHADLYLPHKMMNIFDQVPGDRSGASLFLPIAGLYEALAEADVPGEVAEQLGDLLDGQLQHDGFHRMQQLIYPPDGAPWSSGLELAMMRRCRRLRLGPGQGYLINDRRWLHGREAPTGGVHPRRLHRLVFS